MAADAALPAPDAAREPPSAAGERRRARCPGPRTRATDATLAEFDAVRADVAAMLPVPADGLRDAVDATGSEDGASQAILTVLDGAGRRTRQTLAAGRCGHRYARMGTGRRCSTRPAKWLIRDYLPANRVAVVHGCGRRRQVAHGATARGGARGGCC